MIPQLVSCFDHSVAFIQASVADLSDEELVLQPPGLPNHAAWTLGHIIHSCEAIARELGVPPWLPADWESRFGYGSTPAGSTSECPRKNELLAALSDAGTRLRRALLAADEASLSAPLPNIEAGKIFPTLGDALLQVVVAHSAFHAGQLAAWRRAIGRRPMGVFI